MVTKNIAITEDAYSLLVRHKRSGESFSEVIREHFRKKGHLLDYAGSWADIPEKGWEEVEHHVSEARKGLNTSLRKRMKALEQ